MSLNEARKDGTVLVAGNAGPTHLDPAHERLVTFTAALKGAEAEKVVGFVAEGHRPALLLAAKALGGLDRPARLRKLADVLKAPDVSPADTGNERPWAVPGSRVVGRPQPVIATLVRRLRAP